MAGTIITVLPQAETIITVLPQPFKMVDKQCMLKHIYYSCLTITLEVSRLIRFYKEINLPVVFSVPNLICQLGN